jgi:hypothetical protein
MSTAFAESLIGKTVILAYWNFEDSARLKIGKLLVLL